jgi:hypothetical protein
MIGAVCSPKTSSINFYQTTRYIPEHGTFQPC